VLDLPPSGRALGIFGTSDAQIITERGVYSDMLFEKFFEYRERAKHEGGNECDIYDGDSCLLDKFNVHAASFRVIFGCNRFDNIIVGQGVKGRL